MSVLQKKNNKPIGIDLFAGAGGLSLGFEQAGFDIRYAIEHDKFAAETYSKNRQNKNIIVDVRKIQDIAPNEIFEKMEIKKGELDIIIGGPPCQGFSTSNMKTRNLNNPNNHMIFNFVEFVKELAPKWFLMENVAGLNTFESGLIKKHLIEMFTSIGYRTESLVLNAVNFGVPQNRNRIFFIGNKEGKSMDFVKRIIEKKIEKPITVNDAISDLPKLKNGHNKCDMPYNSRKKKLSKYQLLLRKKNTDQVSNNLVSKNTELVLKRYAHIKQGENIANLAKKKPHLVSNYKKVENCHHWIYLRLNKKKPSVTLNNYRKNMLIHPIEHRGLSVREAARLQSIPDNYIFFGSIGSQQQQVANAVPALLAKNIAIQILKYL